MERNVSYLVFIAQLYNIQLLDLNLLKSPFSVIPDVYLFKTFWNVLRDKSFKSISYL